SYYDSVVRLGEATSEPDDQFRAQIARARAMAAHFGDRYAAHLRETLGQADLGRPEARRARRAFDLLTGRSQLYLQQPKGYYFPELPNVEYAERTWFPWLDRVEAATGDIRAELAAVLEDDAAFRPYVEAEPDR